MELNKGDKVLIIKKIHGHGYDIGDIVTISNVTHNDYQVVNEKGIYYVTDDEIEYILPKNWYVKVTKDNSKILSDWISISRLLNEGSIVGMTLWDDGRISKKGKFGPNPNIKAEHYDFGQEITYKHFLKYVLKQSMKTYKLKKTYPGSGELGITTQDDMSKFPEFWEEVKERYKLGDWVVKLEGFSHNSTDSNYIGAGYNDLPNIFRITDVEDTNNSHMYLGEQCLGTETALIFSNGVRKATKEEIEVAQTVYVGEYIVKKEDSTYYKVGCQTISLNEVEFLKRLVSSPINAKIEILCTKITTELLNRLS